MTNGTIYIATNIKNGMKYVGQTTKTLSERQRGAYNKYFTNALKKYDFNWKEIIININELDEVERFFIEYYDTIYPNGYNFDSGGNKNKQLSEKTKYKISQSLKNRFIREDNPFYGKQHSNDTKLKMKLSKVGPNNPMFGKTPWNKSKSHSQVTKNKISRSIKHNENRANQYLITEPNGSMVKIKNLEKYCRKYGLSSGAMCEISKGKRKHHKGFKCAKIE